MAQIKQIQLAGLGELLFDVVDGKEYLGGAPVNFTCHGVALGATGMVISTVGNDARGERARELLEQKGVITDSLSIVDGLRTGYVAAALDNRGVASYSFPDDVAWDHLEINDHVRQQMDSLDAVCFGSLCQRSEQSAEAVRLFLGGLKPKTVRVFDVNLRQDFFTREVLRGSIERCDIIKLNEEELPVLAKVLGIGGEVRDQLAQIVERFELTMAIYTRGGRGSLLVGEDGSSDHQGYATELVDTIGAGDAFTAAATLGYLLGFSLDEINEHANRVASWVCSQRGATPPLPRRLCLDFW